MAAALIDSTIVLRLLTARIESAINLPYVAHLGEAPHSSGVEVRVAGLRIERDARSIQDGHPDTGTFEASFEIFCDAANMASAIDNISKLSMLAVNALNETFLRDDTTTHELQLGRPSEEIGTGTDAEDRIVGVGLVTVEGMVLRQSGSTFEQRT